MPQRGDTPRLRQIVRATKCEKLSEAKSLTRFPSTLRSSAAQLPFRGKLQNWALEINGLRASTGLFSVKVVSFMPSGAKMRESGEMVVHDTDAPQEYRSLYPVLLGTKRWVPRSQKSARA